MAKSESAILVKISISSKVVSIKGLDKYKLIIFSYLMWFYNNFAADQANYSNGTTAAIYC